MIDQGLYIKANLDEYDRMSDMVDVAYMRDDDTFSVADLVTLGGWNWT